MERRRLNDTPSPITTPRWPEHPDREGVEMDAFAALEQSVASPESALTQTPTPTTNKVSMEALMVPFWPSLPPLRTGDPDSCASSSPFTPPFTPPPEPPSPTSSGRSAPSSRALLPVRRLPAVVRAGVHLELTVVNALGLPTSKAMCRFVVRGKNPNAKFQTDFVQPDGSELVFNFKQLVPGAEEGDVVELEIWNSAVAGCLTMLCRGTLPLIQEHFSQTPVQVSVPLADPEYWQPIAALRLEFRMLDHLEPSSLNLVENDEPTVRSSGSISSTRTCI